MKRGRILSLFLSAVLLVSAIIPCLQLSVNADRSNAISEIKSAWNQLKYETMEAFKPSKNFDKDTEWSIPLEATTDAEKEAGFGSYKFKINKNNVDEGDQWFLVNPSKDNFFGVMPAEDIGDIYMYVSSNKEIKVKICYRVDFGFKDATGASKTHYTVVNGPETTIPADGTPVKLSALNGKANFLESAMDDFARQVANADSSSSLYNATNGEVKALYNVRLMISQANFRNTDTELTVGMGLLTRASNPTFPAELDGSDDLVAIIDAAEDVIADESYIAASKTALQTAVNKAWAVVKTDEQLLVKAMQSTWNELVKNQETVLSMAGYNKTGLNPGKLSINYNQTPTTSNGATNNNYILDASGKPLNDAAHSGVVATKVSTTDEDIANFGNSYVELRKEYPDVVGTEEKNFADDIPSITVGDTIISTYSSFNYRSDITALAVNFYSTKAMKIAFRVWYVPTTGGFAATSEVKIDLAANKITTLDLKSALNSNRGMPVGTVRGMALYIAEIDGAVTDTDVLKVGSIIGNLYDACPASVSGNDVSLATIFNKASSLDFSSYFDNAAKVRFQELINAAKAIIQAELLAKFKTKDELIKVATEELWPSLVKKEPLDIKSFAGYNSSGDQSSYSESFIADGQSDPENLAASRVGVSDAASSGYSNALNSSTTQKEKFGQKYVRLTTKNFESGTALNADKSNDIPYLSTKHSVVITESGYYSTEGLKSLDVTVNSSMAMSLGCRMWFLIQEKADKEGGSGKRYWDATSMEEIGIKAGYTTIDLMKYVEKRQSELDAITNKDDSKYQTEITSVIIVTLGIKSMAEEPDSKDYLEIGCVRGSISATLPDSLKTDPTAIKLYEAMQKLNMDDYCDGEAKDNFILAMEAAKTFSEQEWEEIYNDQDRLAQVIKTELWPKLACKLKFKKRFYHYNSTGLNAGGADYSYDQNGDDAPAGTDGASSGTYWGTWGKPEIYGERYYRLTTQKINPEAQLAADKDIPYLDEKIAVMTVSNSESRTSSIDVPGSHAIYMYMDSSMKMTINMSIWYMRSEDTNGDGEYNDWGLQRFSFDIDEGLNKINIKQLLIDNQIEHLMKYMNIVVVNPCNFEHDVTGADYLEIGSIGSEDYAVVPKKLSTITSLSAIVREAQLLDMDDYIDNVNKTMFQTAIQRAVELLNNLDINLTEHVPVEVYETDASGKRTKLGEDKFGYDEQAKLYDGVTDKDPVVLDAKNKKIDFIFNLNDKMSLYEIRTYLAENNINELEIYTAPVREAIWDDSGLVYRYDGSTPTVLNLGKTFTTPIENQYVRFSFNEVNGDTLKVTEIKCVGKGIQQLAYSNVIEGKKDVMSFADYNYETGKSQFIRFESNKFGDSIYQFKDANVAHDGYLDTIVDFCGGSRSENITYNIVFDLNGLCAVDNIKYYAGSSEEYFPRKMKYYLGSDQVDILDNTKAGTVCVAEFNEATTDENGLYEAKFLARNANYARIEFILDGAVSDDGCYGDALLAVAKDIQVRGLSLNSSKTDAVKSFTDEETGIIVDILKLTEGDVYETVQGMKLTKRKPTSDEVAQATDFGFVFNDWFYTVTFLNYRGEAVTDIGNREIRVSAPISDDEDMDLLFMATLLDGEVSLMEHDLLDIDDNYYISVLFDDPNSVVFAKGVVDDAYIDDEPEEEDPEEEQPEEEQPEEEQPEEEQPEEEQPEPSTDDGDDDFGDEDFDDDEDYDDYDDEDYDDGEDEEEEEPEDEETSTGKKKKYYKVVKKGSGGLSTGAVVGIVSGSAVAVAGGALLIIFRKKIFIPRKKTPKI